MTAPANSGASGLWFVNVRCPDGEWRGVGSFPTQEEAQRERLEWKFLTATVSSFQHAAIWQLRRLPEIATALKKSKPWQEYARGVEVAAMELQHLRDALRRERDFAAGASATATATATAFAWTPGTEGSPQELSRLNAVLTNELRVPILAEPEPDAPERPPYRGIVDTAVRVLRTQKMELEELRRQVDPESVQHWDAMRAERDEARRQIGEHVTARLAERDAAVRERDAAIANELANMGSGLGELDRLLVDLGSARPPEQRRQPSHIVNYAIGALRKLAARLAERDAAVRGLVGEAPKTDAAIANELRSLGSGLVDLSRLLVVELQESVPGVQPSHIVDYAIGALRRQRQHITRAEGELAVVAAQRDSAVSRFEELAMELDQALARLEAHNDAAAALPSLRAFSREMTQRSLAALRGEVRRETEAGQSWLGRLSEALREDRAVVHPSVELALDALRATFKRLALNSEAPQPEDVAEDAPSDVAESARSTFALANDAELELLRKKLTAAWARIRELRRLVPRRVRVIRKRARAQLPPLEATCACGVVHPMDQRHLDAFRGAWDLFCHHQDGCGAMVRVYIERQPDDYVAMRAWCMVCRGVMDHFWETAKDPVGKHGLRCNPCKTIVYVSRESAEAAARPKALS
jgi:hypothetical protein